MLQRLGSLSIREFLRNYWQKRPCVLRGAILERSFWLDADELAGLACEEQFPSRLVVSRGRPQTWSVEYGPLSPGHFSQLGKSHWSILVQHVDRYVDRIAELREQFRFVPNWRLDDVMISYAAPRGTVGPHLDRYDVFLIQGAGRRHWRYANRPVCNETWIPNIELRILQKPIFDAEVVLEPGDVLYLPPGVAHHGVGTEPCVTYSVGFRAPSVQDLSRSYFQFLTETGDESQRFTDPIRPASTNPGAITRQDVRKFKRMLMQVRPSDDDFAEWLGGYLTGQAHGEEEFVADARPTRQVIRPGMSIQRADDVCFAFYDSGDKMQLFARGRNMAVPQAARSLVRDLCAQRVVVVPQLPKAGIDFLKVLQQDQLVFVVRR